ncbi:MAG TPA: hypothetical protein VGN52_12405 [Burkholderiales bacterium]|jgi:hypothetical protein
MATSEAPDDGIPILTDVVDARLPQIPPPRPAVRNAGPSSEFGNSGFGSSGFGPNSAFVPNSIPGAVPLERSGPVTAGPKAPPISGPPSLSEFGGADDRPLTATAPLHPNSAEAFAMRVEEAVLERLMGRLDPLLESRLKENLADLLEKVLADMMAELKHSARGIIREAVAQAVADEIAAQRGNP